MPENEDYAATITAPAFARSEGLRSLLVRLHEAGPGAWKTDREARALIEFSVEKYRRLALKWDRDPADVGHAVFVAMQGEWIRKAHDPWAEITTAVQRELKAEATAERLLISTSKARRRAESDFPRPVRASEHEEFLFDIIGEAVASAAVDGAEPSSPSARRAARVLAALGWPPAIAETVVEYVVARLSALGDRGRAFESLRRDEGIPAQLDMPRRQWTRLLRLLLGAPAQPGVPAPRGLLIRLVLGESTDDLLADDDLVLEIVAIAPGVLR